MSGQRICSFILGIVIIGKLCGVWYGFDRLPLVTNTDEYWFSQAPLAMSRGEGLVMKSMTGVMNLDKYYALHPPVYLLTQAAVFRMAGFSPLTLRGVSILCFSACMFFVILLFYRLKKARIFDAFAFWMATLLFLSDPVTFTIARSGRSDMLGFVLGVAAFLPVISSRGIRTTLLPWIGGAFLIGAALATHVEFVLFWAVYSSIAYFSIRKKSFFALVVSIPLLVYLGLWVMVYQVNTFGALQQFFRHVFLKTDFSCNPFLSFFFGSLQGWVFFLFAVIFVMCTAILSRVWYVFSHKDDTCTYLRRRLFFVSVFTGISIAYVCTVTGCSVYRGLVVMPILLFCFGVAISYIRLPYRRLIAVVVGALIVTGLVGHVLYLSRLPVEWRQRDPQRFASLVTSIPTQAKIVTVSSLWYALESSGHRNVSIIDLAFPEDRKFWEKNRDTLASFDVILLPSDHPLLPSLIAVQRGHETVVVGKEIFYIFR
ncbi:MAG TPA: hypothetical protein PKL77_02405 [Candidatus Omnitrophota bacterium]|nr:hypothetical protein [Candidatus Omnitrophota bacterium]